MYTYHTWDTLIFWRNDREHDAYYKNLPPEVVIG